MTDTEDQSAPGRGAFQVVLAYAVFAALWILLSDWAMGLMITDHDLLVQAGTIKGWLFVAVTSLLLYVLVRRFIGQLQSGYERERAAVAEQQRTLQLLTTLVADSDDAIFAKDTEGRYLLFNEAAAAFVGKRPEEVIGRDDHAIVPREQAEMLMAIGRRVMATEKTETNEEVVDTTSGQRVFLSTKSPLRDEAGRVTGIFGISRDITERKRHEDELRNSEQRFRALFDNSLDGVLLTRTDGSILAVNPEAQRIFGYSEAELRALGRAAVTDASDPRLSAALAERERSGHFVGEITMVRKDGSQFTAELSSQVFGDGSSGRMTSMVVRDITSRKIAEAELKLRHEELERFNRAAIGREMKVIELKQQINVLSQELGRPPPHPLTASLSSAETPSSGEAD